MSCVLKIDFSQPNNICDVLRAMNFEDGMEVEVENTDEGVLFKPAIFYRAIDEPPYKVVTAKERARIFEELSTIEFNENSEELVRILRESRTTSDLKQI